VYKHSMTFRVRAVVV